jgi:hypothetical protein
MSELDSVLEGCTSVLEGCTSVLEGCTSVLEGCTNVLEGCTSVLEGSITESLTLSLFNTKLEDEERILSYFADTNSLWLLLIFESCSSSSFMGVGVNLKDTPFFFVLNADDSGFLIGFGVDDEDEDGRGGMKGEGNVDDEDEDGRGGMKGEGNDGLMF